MLKIPLNQREFVRKIIDKNYLWQAILIGIIGSYSFHFMSFLTRLLSDNLKGDELTQMLIKSPISVSIYFLISIAFIYLVSYLFGGRKPIKELVIAQGFGGLYAVMVSSTLTPVTLISKFKNSAGNIPQPLIMVILVFILIGIISAFYSIKYSIISISEIFEFKVIKSTIIWLITFIPLFLIYSEISKMY